KNDVYIGGLITCFIAAAMVHLPKKENMLTQGLAFGLYIILIIVLIVFGIYNNENDPSYQLSRIDHLLEINDFEKVVDITTETLDDPGRYEAPLLFQRSYAYKEIEEFDLAIQDLEKSIKLDDEESIPESYYNLALLYYETGEQMKAEEAIKEAYNLNPQDENYIDLYEEITGQEPTH